VALRAVDSIRAGRPLAEHDYGAMDRDALVAFFRGQHPDALLAGRKLADAFDLSDCRQLADIGGGSGGMAIAICERFPDLRGTVLDLPNVVPVADDYLSRSSCGNRIGTVACDLLRGPLKGSYDVAVMRAFLQVLGPSQCRDVLANVREGLAPGARLFIVGQIVDNDRAHPQTVAMFNLVFLSFYRDGRAHTEAEHREWLDAAGFTGVERRALPNGLNLMQARA
jgi:cyclopropane fatty-acyl-phospholipid synthase-like methyltransferase